MVIVFDTSVLVAAFVTSHPKHEQASASLKKIKEKHTWLVSAHTLAECYAVLTRLPLSPKLTPPIARILLDENIIKYAEIISLSSKDYTKLIKETAEKGLSGGIIYDAIILMSAQKAKADKIFTFNLKDFRQLLPQNPGYFESP
jgi:predicted nucleic acid-binding protein